VGDDDCGLARSPGVGGEVGLVVPAAVNKEKDRPGDGRGTAVSVGTPGEIRNFSRRVGDDENSREGLHERGL